MKKLIFMLSIMFISFAFPHTAISKKKIVLLPFKAKSHKRASKKIRKFIKNIIKQNYEYITKKTIKEQMEKDIKFKDITAEQMKEISQKMEITGYIGGELKVKGRNKYFTIYLYSWETGEPVLQEEFKFRRAVPRRSLVENITAKCLEAIESLKEYTPPPPPKEEEPVVKQVAEENEKPEELVKPIVHKKPKKAEPANFPKFRASLYQGSTMRSLDFDPATEPYYKTAGLAWTIALGLDVYPYAFVDNSSILSNIGLGFYFSYLPGFTTYPANDDSSTVDTTVLDFSFDLRYRHPFTKDFAVVPFIGYSKKTWSFADNEVLDVPSVDYSSMQIGADILFNISKMVKLEGGLSFYLPLDAGEIVKGDYYGEASLFGFNAKTFLSFNVIDSLDLFGGFSYTQFNFSFNGYGAREASSATDKQILFVLGGRYSL